MFWLFSYKACGILARWPVIEPAPPVLEAAAAKSLQLCLTVRPHGLQTTRLLRPWDFPGKSAGVDCHFLLQKILPTQESNLGLPHCRQTLYCLSHQGSPLVLKRPIKIILNFHWALKLYFAEWVKRLLSCILICIVFNRNCISSKLKWANNK